MASSTEAVDKAFTAKRRRPGHSQAFIGSYQLHRTLHVLPDETLEMIRTLHKDLNMSFGIVAPFRADHPLLQNLSPATLEKTTKNEAVCVYIGGGSLLAELGMLNDQASQLVVGSSANLTGTGQKYCVEDIDPDIMGAVDLIVDYGLQQCHVYGGRTSTTIDFEHIEVLRVGSSYELLRERLMKYWGVVLPMGPLFDAKSRAGESGRHNTS